MTITTQPFTSINVGTNPNDGSGDELRVAFQKVNSNYSNISSIGFNAGNVLATGTVQAANVTATYVVANTITTSSGNLTIDPYNTSDVVFPSGTTLWLNDTSPTTNTTSGALISYGGVGIAGNLATGAGRVSTGYQFSNPTSNVAVTINAGIERLILAPTAVLSLFGANVTLPNVTADGTLVSISSNVAVAGLQVTTQHSTLTPAGNVALAAGSSATYLYHASETKWYKVS